MPPLAHSRADFPDDFLFGVATSAYQIEGHAQGGAGQTHWDSFAATPGNVSGFENGALACDHLTHWERDLDLIQAAGFDVYRFSTSWARIQPDGQGKPNMEGLDFYDRLIDGLLARGIKPAATLYHWELPSPLADIGGWTNRDIAARFAAFTEIVMARLGDRLWSVAPINEPWCVSWLAHFEGQHAPGLRDIRAAARAMHHVLLAHGSATTVMRDTGHKNLGAVCNFEFATPLDATPEAKAAAARYDAIYNRFFLQALTKGTYPDLVLKGLAPHLPKGWQDDMAQISQPLDWLGLNYYTRKVIAPRTDSAPWPAYRETTGELPQTDMGWEIYPEGLYHFLTRTARDYTGTLPLYVTENGMAAPDHIKTDGTLQDSDRIAYLDAHLAAVARASQEAVPVKGYYAWSLLDNYEWAMGYGKRFGLVHVDFDTLERRPKASYHALKVALTRS
ncbi:MAG: GH1 family beta-glucosidase [Maritimibacter sp.]